MTRRTDVRVEKPAHGCMQLVDRYFPPTCDIDGFTANFFWASNREKIPMNYVCDECEIPRLIAVTINDGSLPLPHRLPEGRDNRGIGRIGILPRTKYVEIAKRHCV